MTGPKIIFLLCMYLFFMQATTAQSAQEQYQRGRTELELKNAPVAEKHFSNAIAQQPSVAEYYLYRAIALTRQGKNDLALADLDKALSLNRKLGAAYYQRANIKAFMQQPIAALADFDSAISLNSHKDLSHREKAAVLVEQKNYEAAIQEYTAALSANPRFAEALYGRAMAQRQLQRYTEAIQDFTQAMEFKMNYQQAIHFRGITKIAAGDKEGGCEDLKTSAKLGNPVSHESMKVYCR